MNKSVANIGIILVTVIVFPTLFFSGYEIVNNSNNQKVVDSIYSSQLSSIVLSLNQYSSQIVSRWADSVDNDVKTYDGFLKNNIAIDYLFVKKDTQSICYSRYNKSDVELNQLNNSLNKVVENNSELLIKLQKYMQSGWRKLFPIEPISDTSNLLLFVGNNNSHNYAMLIDPVEFVKENLGPRMQSMGHDKFVISVYKNKSDEEVYNSDVYGSTNERIRIREALWLFNNYEIGIKIIGDPIEKMVTERTRTNIIMIIIMDIVLLLGAWFVYRSVREQVRLAQIKSEFVSNVSHEIKTPLALINMYSETLEMDRVPTEEKKKEYYKVINKEARRLSRMVNKILNFAKIENGKREYKFTNFELNEIVDQVVSTYQHHFKNKGFEHEIKLADDLPQVNLDAEAIIDSVYNLIDNAIKYSAETKHIEINTGIDVGYAYIGIKDSGIGISQKNQNHIFDKFYRVTEGNLALQAKGSGIGLNIVKHIMDAHNGYVKVESEIGKGSYFKLMFPIHT